MRLVWSSTRRGPFPCFLFLGGFLAVAPAFIVATASPVQAQQPQRDEPRLDDLEEQVLRSQIENYVNEFAHWDADKKRVVIDEKILRRATEGLGKGGDGQGDGRRAGNPLAAVEPMIEMMLQRMLVPDEEGRLHLRDEVKLRPFAEVIQNYIADGGIEDIEAFQRYRMGNGENPFKNGMPPRISKAVAGLMKALNGQGPEARPEKDEPRRVAAARPPERADDEQVRKAEERLRKAEEKSRKAEEQARRAADEAKRELESARREAESARRRDDRREEPRARSDERRTEEPREGLQERLARRFDMDEAEIDELRRYAEDLAKQAERDLERMGGELRERFQEFQQSDRGRDLRERLARLGRRAEDELRRALESEDVRDRLEDAQRRAMDFLASPEGQEMQRRMLEWLGTEDGRQMRRRVEEFMTSERGQDLLRRLGERFAGRGKPEPKREPAERAGPAEPRDEKRAVPAPEPRRERDDKRRARQEF